MITKVVLLPFLLDLFGHAISGAELHRLLKEGHTEQAKALLAKDRCLLKALNDLQETPLHVAAHLGQVGMVEYLLKRGAEVNACAYNQFAPLHLATDHRVVKLLLKYKADINAPDCSGRSPLHHSASEGRRRLVKLLWKAGAVFDVESAIFLGDIHLVRAFLRKNPMLARDPKKELLCLAAREGYILTVKLLLKYKADPNAKDSVGMPRWFTRSITPIMLRRSLMPAPMSGPAWTSRAGGQLPQKARPCFTWPQGTTGLLLPDCCWGAAPR
jgi:ankyrin repeat protein